MNIYVTTNDIFLRQGLLSIFSPLGFQIEGRQFLNTIEFSDITSEDLVLIDSSCRVYENIVNLVASNTSPKIAILSRNKGVMLSSITCISGFIDVRKPFDEFCSEVLSAGVEIQSAQNKSIELSQKEKYIFVESMNGKSAASIAQLIGISPKTVYAQRTKICRKFGAHNLNQIVPFTKTILDQLFV